MAFNSANQASLIQVVGKSSRSLFHHLDSFVLLLFNRSRGQVTLIVDDQMISGELTGIDGVLNTDGVVWLGEFPLPLLTDPEITDSGKYFTQTPRQSLNLSNLM